MDRTEGKKKLEQRTRARLRAKQKALRAENQFEQLESAIGGPLRQAIANQSQSIVNLDAKVKVQETDLMKDMQGVRDRMVHFECDLNKIIRDEVEAAMIPYRKSMEQLRSSLEQQFAALPPEVKHLKISMFQEQDKQKLAVSTIELSIARRLEELENTTRNVEESKDILSTLIVDFDNYVGKENERELYTRRLEVLVKDIEQRVWPWRVKRDRSGSPPPGDEKCTGWRAMIDGSRSPPVCALEKCAAWQVINTDDEKKQLQGQSWIPWPTNGIVQTKASPATSHGPTPPPSARPTPPTSRPSSARFRGRDPGLERRGSLGTARPNRPGSASSARSGR